MSKITYRQFKKVKKTLSPTLTSKEKDNYIFYLCLKDGQTMQSVKAMIALTRKKEIATSAINILEIEDITEEGGYKHPVISVLMNCTAAEYVILKDRLYKNIKPYIIGSIVPTEDEIKEFAL